MSGREIFVFIDGTSCNYSNRTNIHRMFNLFKSQKKCKCLYHPGVASNSSLKNFQIFVASEIITEAIILYARLSDLDLTPDDHLYIFGYSRGAILARILAQMVTNSEALETVIKQTDHPYHVGKRSVDFLGLFDPVIGKPYFFERRAFERNAHLNPQILGFTEIVAMDEGFSPYASEAASVNRKKRPKANQNVAQPIYSAHDLGNNEARLVKNRNHILVPGVHGDIGGQNSDLMISTHATLTMLDTLLISSPSLMNIICQTGLRDLKSNLDIVDTFQIGKNTPLFKKLLQKKRAFNKLPGMELHSLSDTIVGKSVTKFNLLNRNKKYEIPKNIDDLPRRKYSRV